MKSTRILPLSLLAVILILGQPFNAAACSCPRFTPCESFGMASAVFVGRVIGGSQTRMGDNEADQAAPINSGVVEFAVEEIFKGVTASRIEIMVGFGCLPLSFVREEQYLVYGYTNESSKTLFTHSCSRTVILSRAKEDLDFLRSLPPAGIGGRIYGNVKVDKRERESTPLADIAIAIDSETGQHQQVKTDSKGEFELRGLTPGTYKVTPLLPDNYAPTNNYHTAREVVVADRACAKAAFSVHINGKISGRVFDP